MPGKTKRQRGFAAMSATPKGRAKLRRSGKKPMPVKVGKDFRRKPR